MLNIRMVLQLYFGEFGIKRVGGAGAAGSLNPFFNKVNDWNTLYCSSEANTKLFIRGCITAKKRLARVFALFAQQIGL